jgi:hypothetical protein
MPDSWQLVTPPSGIVSAVILLLRKTPDTSTDPMVTIGDCGCAIPQPSHNQDPRFLHLQGDTHHLECSKLLLAVAGSLRQGKLHGGQPPYGMNIETTLWEVAKFLDSRGLGDPRRSTPGQPFLDTQFADILGQSKMEDPAPQPQQALPSSSTIRLIADVYGKTKGDSGPHYHHVLLPPTSRRIYPNGWPAGTEETHHPTPTAGHHVLETSQSHPSRYQSTDTARG